MQETRSEPSLVILDRDGVINHDSDQFIKTAEEWIPLPGSVTAIARLSRAGYRIAVATNQSGIARGLLLESDLAAMHDKLQDLVAKEGGRVDGFFHCPHGPDKGCECRKPEIGLLRRIEEEFAMPVAGAPFVGDSARDLEAARRAGCRPVLVLSGKGERTREAAEPELMKHVTVYPDLAAFADGLLNVF